MSCAVCGKDQSVHYLTKFGLDLGKCLNCSMIFATPRLSKSEIWQRYSHDYFYNEYLPAHGIHDNDINLERFDADYTHLFQMLRSKVPQSKKMLEIGAGAGLLLKAAERAGWDVVGIEVSEAGVNFGQKELGLAKLKLPKSRFLKQDVPSGRMMARSLQCRQKILR